MKKFLKKTLKILLVIIIILIFGCGFIIYKSRYAKLPEGVIRVSSEEEYYKTIKKAISNYDKNIVMAVDNFDRDTYDLDVFDKVLKDTPELTQFCIGAKSGTKRFTIPTQLEFNIEYSEDPKILKEKEKAVQAKITQIVKEIIKPGMKDYEKELALHDYLVKNSSYDSRVQAGSMSKDYNTAYGILINKTGICGGYADAMNRLLNAAGIESIVVFGDATSDGKDEAGSWIGHSWNIVKIGGEYYHLDSTWNDPITEDGSDASNHEYFNVSDNQISKTHRWDRKVYPKCISEKYNSKI